MRANETRLFMQYNERNRKLIKDEPLLVASSMASFIVGLRYFISNREDNIRSGVKTGSYMDPIISFCGLDYLHSALMIFGVFFPILYISENMFDYEVVSGLNKILRDPFFYKRIKYGFHEDVDEIIKDVKHVLVYGSNGKFFGKALINSECTIKIDKYGFLSIP